MTIIKWQSMPQINRLYNNLFENENATGFGKNCGNIPATNILEKEKEYEIQLAFPGVEKKDIDISLENNVLKISYEAKESNDENYLRQEFDCESFTRSFIIPKETSIDNIEAAYENGILKVKVPKAEKAKIQKSITVS
jgi:HSP20 family protein